MKRSTALLATLGASLCFAVTQAAAQGGRGMGRTGTVPPGQVSRPAPGPPAERGSATGRESRAASHATDRHPSMAASQALQKNPELSSRLQSLLPAGTNVSDAAAGFKNTGQFVSAVHVSHNLGIPFDTLKTEMLAQGSLGKALQTLKPDMPGAERDKEIKKAETTAKEDMKRAGKPKS